MAGGALKRTIGSGIGHILYGGASASSLAPFTFELGVGQFPYNVDYSYADDFNYEPIESLKAQQDQRESSGEHSLNPAGLWRRSTSSFHLGAGQSVSDRPNSSEYRFRSSVGVEIFKKWELGLLEDTDKKLDTANTNVRFAVAGSHLYFPDGTALKFTTNIDVDTPTFTALTGTPPANAATSITTDGFNVFTAHGTNGIWKTTRGTAAWAGAAHITGTAALVAYVRGRVLAANANSVWDITVAAQGGGGVALGGVGAPLLFTHPNVDFKWTSFAEGRNAIYMGGYSGDKSLIYKAVIKSDGTGLDAPVVAGEFDGEQVEALYGYLGPFLFIGVGGLPGWRFAQINQNGDLNIGARVDLPKAVLCFEGQNSFVWFGWSNHASGKSGLGRLNVQEFGDPDLLVPAYTSDLMAGSGTQDVISVATFQGIRVFSLQGNSIWATHHLRNKVPSGTLDTGEILFNMNEDKIGVFVDVVQLGMGGTHGFYVSADQGPFGFLGEHEEHHESFRVGEVVARSFELRAELKRDSVDLTSSQRLAAWMFRAQIIPSVTTIFTIPVYIASLVTDLDGIDHNIDPWAQLDNIQTLQRHKEITQLKIGNRAYPIIIEKYRWRIHKLDDLLQSEGFNGTCFITFKIISEDI